MFQAALCPAVSAGGTTQRGWRSEEGHPVGLPGEGGEGVCLTAGPSPCRPYLIDLQSTNGTYINNQRIDPARYVELKEKVTPTAVTDMQPTRVL